MAGCTDMNLSTDINHEAINRVKGISQDGEMYKLCFADSDRAMWVGFFFSNDDFGGGMSLPID